MNRHLSGNSIRVYEPYCIFVFYEKELTDYRNRLAAYQSDDRLMDCKNRYAYEHIGIVQDFVNEHVQKDVSAERERHLRGYATFDMLWLLYKPGTDVYFDIFGVGEHEPWVFESVRFGLVNGVANTYEIICWHLSSIPEWVGPRYGKQTIRRFAGEKEIVSLLAFPCEYLSYAEEVGPSDAENIRKHFVDRGRKWYDIQRRKKCYQFDGITTTQPRTMVRSNFQRALQTLRTVLKRSIQIV